MLAGLGEVDHIISDPPYDLSDETKTRFLAEARAVARGNIVLFCKPENQWPAPDEWLFWVKTPSTKNHARKCGRFVEMIAVYRSDTFNRLHWSQMIGVYNDLLEDREHPYQKPLALMERLVRIYTNPGDAVLDPFAGSGTTGVACRRHGRSFIGAEENEEVFLTAQRRLLLHSVHG